MPIEETEGLTYSDTTTSVINNPNFLLFMNFVIVLLALFITVYVVRKLLNLKTRKSESFKRVVILVKMAKEAEELAEKEDSSISKKKDLKEAIAITETLYSNFEGTQLRGFSYWRNRWLEFWTGAHSHITLEIFVQKGLIYFALVVPHYMTDYIEEQVLAIYPTAQLEVIDDYNIFQANSSIEGAYVTLTQNTILPIRTYKYLDTDPLESITNTLSKIEAYEGASLQIVLRPAHPKWRKKALAVTRQMQQGKKLNEALGSSNNWAYSLLSMPIRMVEVVVQSMFASKKTENTAVQSTPNKPDPSQKEEDLIKLIEENASKVWFETNVRIVVSAANKSRASGVLANIISSLAQLKQHRISNGFKQSFVWFKGSVIDDFIYRNFSERHKVVLSSEELASIFHFPLSSSGTQNIAWLATRTIAPPTNLPDEGVVLGSVSFKGKIIPVRMKQADRRRHLYMIGKSGMGKTTLMETMASQDIKNGEGVCVIDPHGDLVNDLLTSVPVERMDDVIYFDPSDTERPIGLNMLEATTPEEMDFVTQEMISMFYQLVTDPSMIGPMFEHSMRNAMFTLMANKEYPGTIADIPRMFTDTDFQKYALTFVTDPMVKAYWEKEMAQQSEQQKGEMLGYLISKVGRFVENGLMRNIIGQQKSGFDFDEAMNSRKIILVNLSKGKIGDINSSLLGLIIVSKITMAALKRASLPEEERKDFYLYIDEFQNYITDSISTILSEARKYRLCLTIAHQYIGQLVKNGDPKIKEAVLGNAGTIVSFKIGIEDAEIIAKEFAPAVNAFDLVNVEKAHGYIKLLIDNQSTKAFTMETTMVSRGPRELAEKLKQLSRLKYGRERSKVEAEILTRTKLGSK